MGQKVFSLLSNSLQLTDKRLPSFDGYSNYKHFMETYILWNAMKSVATEK